jgi:Flp pilus assembly protein TadB
MATDLERPEGALEPPTEEVHLPEPSNLPAAMALGITIAVVGVVLSPIVFAIGFLVFLVTLVRWVRQTREEMAELPLGH